MEKYEMSNNTMLAIQNIHNIHYYVLEYNLMWSCSNISYCVMFFNPVPSVFFSLNVK